MTPPGARRRSRFIDAVIDDYAAAHSTSPDAAQLELQRVTRETTGRAAGMQIGDDQAVLMEMLVRAKQSGFAFIDAGKTGYARYYQQVRTRLRPGGLMLLDNTLQGGHVAGDVAGDDDVAAIRSVNDAIAADPRVKAVPIPIGDGVSFVQKLGERQ